MAKVRVVYLLQRRFPRLDNALCRNCVEEEEEEEEVEVEEVDEVVEEDG